MAALDGWPGAQRFPPSFGANLGITQAQDSTFYGAFYNAGNGGMVKFDQSGNVIWSVPNDSPQIATADGGVIGYSGITYDSNGNATGQIALPIQSWTGGESGIAYQYGSVDQTAFTPAITYATPDFSSFSRANQSGNGASALCHDLRDQLITEYPQYGAGFLPVCFSPDFVASSDSGGDSDPDFLFSVLNQDDIQYNDYPSWAILKSSLLNGLEAIYKAYGQPLTVTSAYRSPMVQYLVDKKNIAAGKYKKPSPNSQHLHGDAVDIRTSGNLSTWKALDKIARQLYPNACIEPYTSPNGGSTLDHIHNDWRPWSQCTNPYWRQ